MAQSTQKAFQHYCANTVGWKRKVTSIRGNIRRTYKSFEKERETESQTVTQRKRAREDCLMPEEASKTIFFNMRGGKAKAGCNKLIKETPGSV